MPVGMVKNVRTVLNTVAVLIPLSPHSLSFSQLSDKMSHDIPSLHKYETLHLDDVVHTITGAHESSMDHHRHVKFTTLGRWVTDCMRSGTAGWFVNLLAFGLWKGRVTSPPPGLLSAFLSLSLSLSLSLCLTLTHSLSLSLSLSLSRAAKFCRHMITYQYIYTQTCKHTHTHAHTDSSMHTRTHTHTHAHTDRQTYTHTYAHTHIHTHAHTQTDLLIWLPNYWLLYPWVAMLSSLCAKLIFNI